MVLFCQGRVAKTSTYASHANPLNSYSHEPASSRALTCLSILHNLSRLLVLLVGDLGTALLVAVLLLLLAVVFLGVLLAVQTNLVPGEVEELINALEAAASRLGNAQPDPDTSTNTNNTEEVEGTVRCQTIVLEKHVGESLVDCKLAKEMHSHRNRRADSSNSEREQLRGEQVLAAVPSKSPTSTREVDHGNGGFGSLVLGGTGLETLVVGDGNNVEENADVEQSDGLQDDSRDERSLAAGHIDEEERADDGSNKLDDTKDHSREERLLLASDANELKQVRGVL